jgi:hypothetical protein
MQKEAVMNTFSRLARFSQPQLRRRTVALAGTPARDRIRARRIPVIVSPWLAPRPRPASLVEQMQNKLERYGMRAGVAWAQGTTLREYAAQLESYMDGAALREVVDLIEQAQYSGRRLDAGAQRRLQAVAIQMCACLRGWPHQRTSRDLPQQLPADRVLRNPNVIDRVIAAVFDHLAHMAAEVRVIRARLAATSVLQADR